LKGFIQQIDDGKKCEKIAQIVVLVYFSDKIEKENI
jgi:hypothetical protein